MFVVNGYGWVFDAETFDNMLKTNVVVSPWDSVDTLQMLTDLCQDIAQSERGRAALKRFEEECGFQPDID